MIVKFKDYYSKQDVVDALENAFSILEIKTTDATDTVHDMAIKSEFLIRNYCHQLFNRSVFTRDDDSWIAGHIIDCCTHNAMDLIAALESTRVLDLNYGKSHQQTSAMNYRNGQGNNQPVLSADVSTFNEQDNLGKAFGLMNLKNQVMDKIYMDLELICLPFRTEDDEEYLGGI